MTIKTVETENEGLKRAYLLTIPAKDIDGRIEQEVKKLAPQIKMPGFRPGKVPPNLIRKMHGDRAPCRCAPERGRAIRCRSCSPTTSCARRCSPKWRLPRAMQQGKDAEVSVKLETLPDVPAPKIDKLKLERLTLEADEAAVEQQLAQLAQSQTRYDERQEGPQGRGRRPGRDRLRRQGRRRGVRRRQRHATCRW